MLLTLKFVIPGFTTKIKQTYLFNSLQTLTLHLKNQFTPHPPSTPHCAPSSAAASCFHVV